MRASTILSLAVGLTIAGCDTSPKLAPGAPATVSVDAPGTGEPNLARYGRCVLVRSFALTA